MQDWGPGILGQWQPLTTLARAQEPVSLLKGTLGQLAEHKTAAERYLVVLAMEAGEQGHEAKAANLLQEYGGRCAHTLSSPSWSCSLHQGAALKRKWTVQARVAELVGGDIA